MSKTPFTREHRESIKRLRENVVSESLIAALDAVLEHLPGPEPETLKDGPYLYRHRPGNCSVKFVHDGKATGFTSRDLSGPATGSVPQPIDPDHHDRYEPIILIRGEGEMPADLVDRVHQRVGGIGWIERYAVRQVLQALIEEVQA